MTNYINGQIIQTVHDDSHFTEEELKLGLVIGLTVVISYSETAYIWNRQCHTQFCSPLKCPLLHFCNARS